MTLGPQIEAALPRLRAEAESLLVDRCDLQRKTGATVDPVTFQETPVWTTYRAGVPCRLRADNAQARQGTTGEQNVDSAGFLLAVPLAVDDVQVDDRAVVSTPHDPSAPGRSFYVLKVPRGSQMVYRRLVVQEAQ